MQRKDFYFSSVFELKFVSILSFIKKTLTNFPLCNRFYLINVLYSQHVLVFFVRSKMISLNKFGEVVVIELKASILSADITTVLLYVVHDKH